MGKVINLSDVTRKKVWLFVPKTTEFGGYTVSTSIEETLVEKCQELNYEIVGSTSVCGPQRMIYSGFCDLIKSLNNTHSASAIYTLSVAFIFETEIQFEKIENLLRDMNISLEGLDKMQLPRSIEAIEERNRLVREILSGPLSEHMSNAWNCNNGFQTEQSSNK